MRAKVLFWKPSASTRGLGRNLYFRKLPLSMMSPIVEKGGKPALPVQFAGLVNKQLDDRYTLCETIPCSVVPTRFVSFDELADAFDEINLTDKEDILNDALRLIAPEFEKLGFIAIPRLRCANGQGIFAKAILVYKFTSLPRIALSLHFPRCTKYVI